MQFKFIMFFFSNSIAANLITANYSLVNTFHFKSGFVASLPYLVMWFMWNVVAVLADFVRGNGYLNTTQTRKAFSSIGEFSVKNEYFLLNSSVKAY